MDAADIEKRVMQILTERLGMSQVEITPEARLVEDLGLDSLDSMEMAMALETQFDVSITNAQATQLKTVGDLVAMVRQLVD